MKKLIAVAMLLSLSVCVISSCEDKTEEFDSIESLSIENAQMNIDDEDASEPMPEAP